MHRLTTHSALKANKAVGKYSAFEIRLELFEYTLGQRTLLGFALAGEGAQMPCNDLIAGCKLGASSLIFDRSSVWPRHLTCLNFDHERSRARPNARHNT
ncbi:MAG: hypothetical protein RL011_750, partial [Pseudomonadota bacterium]|jgi:hypothetical protein